MLFFTREPLPWGNILVNLGLATVGVLLGGAVFALAAGEPWWTALLMFGLILLGYLSQWSEAAKRVGIALVVLVMVSPLFWLAYTAGGAIEGR